MRYIDINTTQNVVITYEIAGLRDRILALILDWIFIVIAYGLLSILIGLIGLDQGIEDVILLLLFVLFSFYTLIFEIFFNGQTLGKMILRIKVVSLDGRHLSFYDYLLRWSFRIIDIFLSFGTLAAILSTSSDNGQRLGGMVSNSTVVRLNPKFRIQLRDLLNISSTDSYNPQYTAVRNFSEMDMLLIKQTIERYQRYKNEAHKKAVLELVEVMKNNLGITEDPENKIQFLRGLIRDYVVLTR